MIRVMLADDHEVVRVGFRMILEQDPDVRVVAEAADGAQAYAIVAREKPDILLMDISMPPGQSGLVACEKIAKVFYFRLLRFYFSYFVIAIIRLASDTNEPITENQMVASQTGLNLINAEVCQIRLFHLLRVPLALAPAFIQRFNRVV